MNHRMPQFGIPLVLKRLPCQVAFQSRRQGMAWRKKTPAPVLPQPMAGAKGAQRQRQGNGKAVALDQGGIANRRRLFREPTLLKDHRGAGKGGKASHRGCLAYFAKTYPLL